MTFLYVCGAAFLALLLYGVSHDIQRRVSQRRRERAAIEAYERERREVETLNRIWSMPAVVPDHEQIP